MSDVLKLTPGEWKYGRYTQSIQTEDGERLVASLDMRAEERDPTVHADGQVMGAAKEMYEALRALVEHPARPDQPIPVALWQAARAALAKADGK